MVVVVEDTASMVSHVLPVSDSGLLRSQAILVSVFGSCFLLTNIPSFIISN